MQYNCAALPWWLFCCWITASFPNRSRRSYSRHFGFRVQPILNKRKSARTTPRVDGLFTSHSHGRSRITCETHVPARRDSSASVPMMTCPSVPSCTGAVNHRPMRTNSERVTIELFSVWILVSSFDSFDYTVPSNQTLFLIFLFNYLMFILSPSLFLYSHQPAFI